MSGSTRTTTGHHRERGAGALVARLRLVAAVLLAAVFVQACDGGGGGSGELPGLLALVPADAEQVWVRDLDQLRERGPSGALRDEYEDLSDFDLKEIGVVARELTTLVGASGDDWELLAVEGDVDVAHVRDRLDDGDYDDDEYRGVELWEGAAWRYEAVALLEGGRRMVLGDGETVRRVLRMLDRGSASLLDDQDGDLGRALRRAGGGWLSVAYAPCSLLGYDVRGCRAVGLSSRTGDDEHLVALTIAVLFRSERTAESEMDELARQVEEDSSFDFDIDDVRLDADFVIVTASADEDELSEEDDPSGGESPVPLAPTVAATGDAPATRPPDTGDDHADSAGGATSVTVGDAVTGVLDHARDDDYFAFAAERGQTYRIDVDLGTLWDSVLALYGADSRVLETDDDGGESFGSRITWTAAESGTHYAAVSGWGDTGSYTLTITATGNAAGAADDHADSAGGATSVTVGDAVTGALDHARDDDYFAFAAERGQTYRIDVDLGTLWDSVLGLFDSDSELLEFDDDGGESFGSRITWTAAESGTYYAAVSGWGDTGSYTLTITATGGAPGAADDHADSAGGATSVTVGDAVTGALDHAGDIDYFAFAAERGQTYRIDVDLGTLDDSVLGLYDADSEVVEFDDDGGESFGSRITWTAAESGTYYAAVAAWGSDTGSYTLTVAVTGDAPDTTDDHGDSAGGATSVTVGDAVTGALDHAGDIDYFAFAAERGQTYRIDVDLGTLDDSVLGLYDADSEVVEFDDDGGESFGSRITWTAAESGTYYAAVAAWGSDTGSYTLTVAVTGDAPDTTDDHGDSAGGATSVTVGDAVPGVLDHAGDIDYFAFAAERGQTYRIDVDLGTLDDSLLGLFDSDSELLELDDDGGASFASRIVWTAAESGTYYAAVAGVWGSNTGSYTLTITATDGDGSGPPDGPANQRYEHDGSAVVLTWEASPGADSYTVYYDDFFDASCRLGSSGPRFCEELATDLTVTTFTHADPDRDRNHYWVVACNSSGCSDIDSRNPARVAP